jgi:lysophospholipase L1-like esterase
MAPSHELPLKKRLAFVMILIVFALGSVEIGLHIAYSLRDKRQKSLGDPRADISPYASLPWPKEYFAELRRLTISRFDPFLGWRRPEFHGKYINLSKEGIRSTWNPKVAREQKVKKVFCFGGSTTWGVGARDDFTVPSLLSKRLNQGRPAFQVTNFGEKGYTSTQELIYLVLLLKQKNIPDYVIFYDGVNEVMVGAMNGKPGLVFNFEGMRDQFEGKDKKSGRNKIWQEIKRLKLYRAFADLQGLVASGKIAEPNKNQYPVKNKQEMPRLAEDIMMDYLKNIEVIRHLGQAYGFQCLFVWQPALLTTRSLTAEEKRLDAWNNQDMVAMYRLVYDKMRATSAPNFYNLSTMFDAKEKTIFFSWAHITEEGNALVADRIFQIFQQESGQK